MSLALTIFTNIGDNGVELASYQPHLHHMYLKYGTRSLEQKKSHCTTLFFWKVTII